MNLSLKASSTLPDGTPWSGYPFSYAYDATGNSIEQNKNGLIYSNSFNNLNQNAETRFAGGLAALGTYSSPLAATVTVNNVQAQLHDGNWAATGIPFVQGTNALVRTIQDLAGRSASATSTVVVADRAYAYDANGNMTTNGVFTYVWDCENRLTEVWKNGALVQSNRYDALWRRREKIEYAPDGTAVTNRYIYKDWLVLAITDGDGSLLETYTHGADLSGKMGGEAGGIGGILASTQAGDTEFYAYDFNGNIDDVTSASQTILSALAYTPFGKVLTLIGPFTPRYQFSTKEHDLRIVLIYYGYRFYLPDRGRWMNRDPIQESGGINIYMFVGNGVLSDVDCLGMQDSLTISFWAAVASENFEYATAILETLMLTQGSTLELERLRETLEFAKETDGLIEHLDKHIGKIEAVCKSGGPNPNDPKFDPVKGWLKEIKAVIKNLKQKLKNLPNNKIKRKPIDEAIKRGEECLKKYENGCCSTQ